MSRLENGRREMFCCTCGVGFDAKVAAEYAMSETRGLHTYVKAALREWFKYIELQVQKNALRVVKSS